MTTTTDTTVEIDVDLALTAGCSAFTDCPRTARWVVIFDQARESSWPICEHHRPMLIGVMASVGLDTDQVRFVEV